jgi:hypothetical protein
LPPGQNPPLLGHLPLPPPPFPPLPLKLLPLFSSLLVTKSSLRRTQNKSIHLNFNTSKHVKNHYINPAIFKHPRFDAVLATAVAETYLVHAVRDQQDVDVQEGLLHIGRLIEKISQCNELEFNANFESDPHIYLVELDNKMQELYRLVESLPEPHHFREIELMCTPDIFLEVLMGNIRNSLLSFQAWIQKVKMAKINNIITTLNI